MDWTCIHYLELTKGLEKVEKKLDKLKLEKCKVIISKTTTYRAERISARKDLVIIKSIPMFGDPSVLRLQIVKEDEV